VVGIATALRSHAQKREEQSLTSPDTFDVHPGAPIQVWIKGEVREALVLEISNEHVTIQIPRDDTIVPKEMVALLLPRFASLPMRVVRSRGDTIELRFSTPPHPSVITLAIGKILELSMSQAQPGPVATGSVAKDLGSYFTASGKRARSAADRKSLADLVSDSA